MAEKRKDDVFSYTNESGKTVFTNIKKEPEIKVPPQYFSPPQKQIQPNTQIQEAKPIQIEPARIIKGNKQLQNTFGMIVAMIIVAMAIRFFFEYLDKKITENKKKKQKAWRQPEEKKTVIVHHHHYHATKEPQKETETEKVLPWTIEFIRSLEWREFEKLCAKILEERGFVAILGDFGQRGDGGKDIRIYKAMATERPYALAQCKAQRTDIVVGKIRELRGTMAKENVTKGFFFTSGGFYKIAWEEGTAQKMELITGDMLLEEIKTLPIEKQEAMMKEITSTDYTTPTCTVCGIKMKKRTSTTNGKPFWGCVNYPRCNNKLELRWTDQEHFAEM